MDPTILPTLIRIELTKDQIESLLFSADIPASVRRTVLNQTKGKL